MWKIRFGHFVPVSANVDIYLGRKLKVTNLSYSELTSYMDFKQKNKPMKFFVKSFGTDEVLAELTINSLKEKYNTLIVCLNNKKIKVKYFPTPMESVYSGKSELRFFHFAVNAPEVNVNVNNNTIFTDVPYEKTGKPLNVQYSLIKGLVYNNLKINLSRTNKVVIENPMLHLRSGNVYSIFAHGIVGDSAYPLATSVFIDNPGLYDTLESDFDVQAYMNKWYQIANIPQPFEMGLNCAKQVAQYSYLSDEVKVYNTCLNQEGVVTTKALGKAIIENPQQPAALTVSFPGYVPPSNQVGKFDPSKMLMPPGPNYLIHKTDYDTYSVVGSSDRSGLYILCRKPKMNRSLYDDLLKFCKKIGYNLNKISLDYDTLY
jgi:lipocalin